VGSASLALTRVSHPSCWLKSAVADPAAPTPQPCIDLDPLPTDALHRRSKAQNLAMRRLP
jgi:hypothetical protein